MIASVNAIAVHVESPLAATRRQAAVVRLTTAISEGRLFRGSWARVDSDGRHLVCLLSALSPEVEAATDPRKCPGDLMPPWLAELVPDINDLGTAAAWPFMIARFTASVAMWGDLLPSVWPRVRLRWLRIGLLEALSHAPSDVASAAADAVGLVEVAIAGEPFSDAAQDKALATLRRAAIADGTRLAREVEHAVAHAVTVASPQRSGASLLPTVYQVALVAGEAAASRRAAVAARQLAWDRMTAAFLDALDAENEQVPATAGDAPA